MTRVVSFILFLLGIACIAGSVPPEPAITVPCEIVEWHDGDTPTVRITLDVRVRLLDCWAPEVVTKDAAEKARGFASRDHAAKRWPVGSKAVLNIPIADMDRFDDAITMGRVLGEIYVGDENISAEQVKAGHATPKKVTK